MNKKQKTVVLLGMIIILVMALFPPRKAVLKELGRDGAHAERYWGYSYFRGEYSVVKNMDYLKRIFYSTKSPYYSGPDHPAYYSIVFDYTRLSFQWALVLLLVAGFLLLLSDRDKTAEG